MQFRAKIDKEIAMKKQFNLMMKKIRSEANIKDCFHPNKGECVMPTKRAHSLQRQGALGFLEKDKGGNKYLYVHSEKCYNSEHKFYDLKRTGRKTATTFDGFCSFHDTELFKAIENEPETTDIHNDEHCFLHSYRSFAICAHSKLEEWKLYNSSDVFNKRYSPEQLAGAREGVRLALKDLEKPKQLINNWLINKQYSELEYLTFEYPYRIPVGCASDITPHQLPTGEPIQMNHRSSEPQSSILTTVLPFSDRSVVILAAFPDDELGCKFLEELKRINEIRQQKFLSFFLFEGAENIVVSPHFIEKQPIQWRKQYCGLLNYVAANTTPFVKFDEKTFKINYFDPYSAII